MITEKKTTSYRTGYKVMIEKYNSVQEMEHDLTVRKRTSNSFEDSERKGGDWYGVANYEEAKTLLKNGYTTDLEKIEKSLKQVARGTGKRFSTKNDVVGYAPIVPLAILGVPQSMINQTIKPIKAKVLDLYYDMTESCGTSAKQILENGKKFLEVVVELEQMGYRTNLYSMQSYTDYESADFIVIKVKDSSQPLDLKRMTFPLMHTAFFRLIGFDWYSKTPKGTYRSGYGHALGYEIKNETQLNTFTKEILGKNALYLSGQRISKFNTKWVEEALKDNGKDNKSDRN